MSTGWIKKKLGEICEFEGGSQPPKSEFLYEQQPGYVRFLQIRDFSSDKNITYIRNSKKNRFCNEDDILIGRYGASVGKILTDRAGAYNVALMKTIPNLEVLNRSWFYNYLVSDEFQGPLLRIADRSAQAGFSKEDIYNFPVPVPSLPEQQRIVGILDEAFDGIATAKANAEKNLQNARAIFESHLEAVFTRQGPGWVKTTIGESCILKSGTTVPPNLEKPIGDIPYLKVGDMTFSGNTGQITTSSRFLNRVDVKESAIIPKGSTIFPKRGGAILTNKKRITSIPICADLNIMAAIPSSQLDARLLYFYFLNVDMRALGTGSSIPQINNYDIAPLRISFPKDLTIQQQFVGKLDELHGDTRSLALVYQRKLDAFDELKKSLLHQAFSGQL